MTEDYGAYIARQIADQCGLGDLTELRCHVPTCREPLIGYAPVGEENDAEAQYAREQHHWRVHEIPRRRQQAADELNAHPELLDALIPGAGAVIREHGLRFTWE